MYGGVWQDQGRNHNCGRTRQEFGCIERLLTSLGDFRYEFSVITAPGGFNASARLPGPPSLEHVRRIPTLMGCIFRWGGRRSRSEQRLLVSG
jgi:hypothetical protein